MMLLTAILWFTTNIFAFSSAYFIDDGSHFEFSPLNFPSRYNFRGVVYDFTSGRETPFEIWYDAELNVSRIDYFDGLESTFYVQDAGNDTSAIFTYHNISDNNFCTQDTLEDEINNFLPKVENFTLSGKIVIDGIEIENWSKLVEKEDDSKVLKKTETTLYVVNNNSTYIPRRYVIREFIKKTSVISRFKIVDLYSYKAPDESDLLEYKYIDVCDVGEEEKSNKILTHELSHYDKENKVHVELAFKRYKRYHGKIYQESEHKMRQEIFEKTWRMVDEHNRKNSNFKLELNKFSDRTPEELKPLRGVLPITDIDEGTPLDDDQVASTVPSEFDLRLGGYITRVKDQSSCGSCWAFSAAAAVEGFLAYKKKGHEFMHLSEQALVDCSWEYGNIGCHGGFPSDVLKFAKEKGIPKYSDYGDYLAIDAECHMTNDTKVTKIAGYAKVHDNVKALKQALKKRGPLTLAIHVPDEMVSYSNGIYYYDDYDGDKHRMNHAVTLVGYGTKDGAEYWIIKNSYGVHWGEDGYLLLSTMNNNLGVLDTAYYVY